MILTIDIGNTSIHWGVFEGTDLVKTGSIFHTDFLKSKETFVFYKGAMQRIVISSVVPTLTRTVERLLKKRYGTEVFVVKDDLCIRIPHRYKNIKTLGSDRLVSIYGALAFYSAPFLVIDAGTAITTDYVDASDLYQGGLIIPGLHTSLQGLENRAFLLPKEIKFNREKSILAKNTNDAMASGILLGFAALLDGLIADYRALSPQNMTAILTGGSAKRVKPYMKTDVTIDSDLVLKSLALISERL